MHQRADGGDQAAATVSRRLYVVFSFAGPTPSWYERIVEPNPALPMRPDAKESIEAMIEEIVREQVDLALLAISLRQEIEAAFAARDRAV